MKEDILKDGIRCCAELDLDFDEVYKRTNTSYKPIQIGGNWYSDYKSASSVERIEAFINIGRHDPVQYADQTGRVGWEVARSHVEEVLKAAKSI
jgi:7-cyano-7-deazaguanine synthase